MKHLLLTTIAAVVLVGCGESASELALRNAARYGNIEAVKQHIAAGTDVNAKDKRGNTPLDYAVSRKYPEISDLLRKHGGKTKKELEAEELITKFGADVNAKDKYGRTPLHSAIGKIGKGNKEVVELLIAKGADVNAKDDLIEWTPLFMAVEEGHKEIVELLITADADVNAKGFGGNTPLDLAIFNKDTKVAALLRKHGGKTGAELKAK